MKIKSMKMLEPVFHFYFLSTDIVLINKLLVIKSYTEFKNIHVEGTVSQVFISVLVFLFTLYIDI